MLKVRPGQRENDEGPGPVLLTGRAAGGGGPRRGEKGSTKTAISAQTGKWDGTTLLRTEGVKR